MTENQKENKPNNQKGYLKKFWVILGCLIALLIPLTFFEATVDERESYRNEVVNEISKSWAKAQTVNAPELIIQNGKTNYYFKLENYNAKINLSTETRKKGIFKVPVYTADVELSGTFLNDKNLSGGKTYFLTRISDSKGFVEEPMIQIGNGSFTRLNSEKFPVNAILNSKTPFILKYKIRGLNEVRVQAKGVKNQILINGNWADPSFIGEFLPIKRTVKKDGFSAEWSVPEAASISSDTIPECGVSLLVPVDSYRMTLRAVKYGFLFLSLTFISYFVFEITSKENRRIHPLQYILIGMAMCVFYLLLLSMSEFIAFGLAYFIASAMTIALIGIYTHNVIAKKQNTKFAVVITSILALLYSFLYILLRLQDFSLILGSVGMFMIIALIMYATKDVEWYKE